MTTDLSSQSDLITQLRSRVEGMAERAGQERDALRAERDQVVQERDVLRAEHDQVVQERDVLRTEHDQVVQERDLLREERDQVVQERDLLREERDQVVQERDLLREERDQLVQERDLLREERDQVMKALLHVFPYEHYAEARPDLARMTNDERVIHFVRAGIHEGLSLECSMLCEKLEAMHVEKSQLLVARLSELEVLVSDYSARLSVLQDLFVRLSMEKYDS